MEKFCCEDCTSNYAEMIDGGCLHYWQKQADQFWSTDEPMIGHGCVWTKNTAEIISRARALAELSGAGVLLSRNDLSCDISLKGKAQQLFDEAHRLLHPEGE